MENGKSVPPALNVYICTCTRVDHSRTPLRDRPPSAPCERADGYGRDRLCLCVGVDGVSGESESKSTSKNLLAKMTPGRSALRRLQEPTHLYETVPSSEAAVRHAVNNRRCGALSATNAHSCGSLRARWRMRVCGVLHRKFTLVLQAQEYAGAGISS
ncbi:unnamed protein product [Rangifer tarandus platyrhynchus]|uniref:Uncharacterized protein n=1 Tax=Rangifer tarandus platyrhynchus TaxID=3082113 RepID=A0ABN8XNZ4_RANTA|nr:unnamed protein product [Rangifer tarandus platyrhynchus]